MPNFRNALFSFCLLISLSAYSQHIPLVYQLENSGISCPQPPILPFEKLPEIRPLPDPFEWSDGRGRVSSFADWACRRAEISAEIQHFEIGTKPGKPDKLTAHFKDTLLTVNITVGEQTLVLKSKVILPEGKGPFPAVIGMGGPSGSLSRELFASRNIAMIAFDFSQVMAHTQKRGQEPINKLYPELIHMGAYSAWSWGVSRLIDGLELTQGSLPIDLSHLAVTGCSFAGKMAMFAGAFDERIALTIAQESGGGGGAAWRVSQTLGNVETLGSTSRAWFMEDMFRFSNQVAKLPHDHHELMAMIAPRALLFLGNPDYQWLAEESGYVSCKAAKEVWKAFGIGDRFGISIVAGHPHCRLPESQVPEVSAFIDRFMLGKNVDTNVEVHPFETVNDKYWYEWWGKGKPVFPKPDMSQLEFSYYEAECGEVGKDWQIKTDAACSGDQFVEITPGQNSAQAAQEGMDAQLSFEIEVKNSKSYHLFGRLNCASAEDDSFWVKIDNMPWLSCNGLGTSGWEWVSMTRFDLTTGKHVLKIAYREDGAKMDKLLITDYAYGPESTLGEKAGNCDE